MVYALAVALTSVLIGLSLLYRYLLPRPIAGIPYNKSSCSSIFGDLPGLVKYVKVYLEPFAWFALQCRVHQSPIVQVWIKPLQGPIVILSDFQESQDILLRRTKEFDRAPFFEEVLYALVPHATIRQKTNETFKAQRRAFSGTMSSSFIHSVAAPQIHQAGIEIVRLWQRKRTLAKGRPIVAAKDIQHCVFSAIWAVTFGLQLGIAKTQLHNLELAGAASAGDVQDDKPALFSGTNEPAIYKAVELISNSVGVVLASPFPRLHHKLYFQLPKMRRAKAIKDKTIEEAIDSSLVRFSKTDAADKDEIRSAMDLVLRQQSQITSKGGDLLSDEAMRDELLTFLIAASETKSGIGATGHETTATALTWAFKYMTAHQDVQARLRHALEVVYKVDRSVSNDITVPEPQAIMESHIPYLDAVMEEVLRLARTAQGISRIATTDATVLGHLIPKGTEVFCMNNGPGFLTPSFNNEKYHRTVDRGLSLKVGQWNPEDMGLFKPDRWILTDELGGETFNPNAGPAFPFSMGIRGCFGKKLAYAELRIILSLVLLNFELQPLPDDLNNFLAVNKLTRVARQSFIRLGGVSVA